MQGGQLTGAGSTFDYPFFSRAFYDYYKEYGKEVNYQPIGSGGGILQLMKGTVQFGATDVPMNAGELAQAAQQGGEVLQIPITLGAEAIAYNVPGVHGSLRFTGPLLAAIYLGTIRYWDSPQIRKLNQAIRLPHVPILVVHRSDGSGTTYIFTDYLSHSCTVWAKRVGTGKSILWPTGVGGKGNTAVAQLVQSTPGAIGYVELAYVLQTHMSYGMVENRYGKFLLPSLKGATAAASQFPEISSTNFSIVNAPGERSYPISGYSWVVVYKRQPVGQGQAVQQLLTWLVTKEQRAAPAVGNAELPLRVAQMAMKTLQKIVLAGTPSGSGA